MKGLEASIRELPEKKLIGMNMEMSVMENQTTMLWQSFLPRHAEIKSVVSSDKWAVQVYPSNYFDEFNPGTKFIKWSVVEVSNVNAIPEGMELLKIPAGLYAVFLYKGHSGNSKIFHYIFSKWIPTSGYVLDNRPHFEILGEKFRVNDPLSEEEIWIPIRK